MNKTAFKIVIIICIVIILGSLIYKYREPLKVIAGVGAIGLGAWLAAGGTLAGYKLYQKYKALGIDKEAAAIETEAAAGATEVSATGEAITAAGEVVEAGEITTAAATGLTAAEAAATTAEAVGAGAEVLEIVEGLGLAAVVLL